MQNGIISVKEPTMDFYDHNRLEDLRVKYRGNEDVAYIFQMLDDVRTTLEVIHEERVRGIENRELEEANSNELPKKSRKGIGGPKPYGDKDVIEHIVSLKSNGETAGSIARRLNIANIPSPTFKIGGWSEQTVTNILKRATASKILQTS
jgi:hypothetical protein